MFKVASWLCLPAHRAVNTRHSVQALMKMTNAPESKCNVACFPLCVQVWSVRLNAIDVLYLPPRLQNQFFPRGTKEEKTTPHPIIKHGRGKCVFQAASDDKHLAATGDALMSHTTPHPDTPAPHTPTPRHPNTRSLWSSTPGSPQERGSAPLC